MSRFQNEAFRFDFVKCLVQTLRQSGAMATDLSFRFISKLLHMFYFVKIDFNFSQHIHTQTRAFDTLNFPTLTATKILIL